MIQWFKNFIEHPATTIQGVTGGAVLVAFTDYMSQSLHCDWSLFSFSTLVTFLVPVIIGGGAAASAVSQPKANA